MHGQCLTLSSSFIYFCTVDIILLHNLTFWGIFIHLFSREEQHGQQHDPHHHHHHHCRCVGRSCHRCSWIFLVQKKDNSNLSWRRHVSEEKENLAHTGSLTSHLLKLKQHFGPTDLHQARVQPLAFHPIGTSAASKDITQAVLNYIIISELPKNIKYTQQIITQHFIYILQIN